MTKQADVQRFAFAASAVRLWTRLYTWRLDPDVRSRRVAEIESDLWEGRHDTPPLAAWGVLVRLGRGIPADLSWQCKERWESMPRPVTIAVAGVIGGVVTVAVAYWVIVQSTWVAAQSI